MHCQVLVNQIINVMKSIVFSLVLIATNLTVGMAFYKIGNQKAETVISKMKKEMVEETLSQIVYVLPEVSVVAPRLK